MTRSLVAAVSVAVLTSLAALAGVVWLVLDRPGTADPAPTSAELRVGTVEEFCAAFLDPFRLTVQEHEADFGANYREYADRMLAAGLPADAPPRVRLGLVTFADLASELPADVLGPGSGDMPDVSPEADQAYRAFDRWSRRTCGKPY